jgi:hypothetical protein
MGKVNQNGFFILIEENETDENEMNIEEHVERVESGNVNTKNSIVKEMGNK